MSLKVNGICQTYPGDIKALQDVDLELSTGLFGLLGPNGAGKSTLMRILATLQLPAKGSIELDGTNLLKSPKKIRKVIGYLPQEFGVYPRVTARELLSYFASLKGISAKERSVEVNEKIELVDLGRAADRRLGTYSGGMKQRVGIAAALIGSPRLLIVDEPTAGLDPLERRKFQLLLSKAAEKSVVIISSHIVDDIADLCDRLAILYNGRIVSNGCPDKLLSELDGKVWEVFADFHQLDSYHQSHKVLSWQPFRGQLKIRLLSDHQPVNLKDASLTKPHLEDLYALHTQA